MATFGYDEVWNGLEELLKLSNHYAAILNQYDGGHRVLAETPKDWLLKLRQSSQKEK